MRGRWQKTQVAGEACGGRGRSGWETKGIWMVGGGKWVGGGGCVGGRLRIRIYTEDKAKVVVASWRTELLHILAAPASFAPGRVEEYADLHPIIQLVLGQISLFFSHDRCLFFCIHSSFKELGAFNNIQYLL